VTIPLLQIWPDGGLNYDFGQQFPPAKYLPLVFSVVMKGN